MAAFIRRWREDGGAAPPRQAFVPLRFAPGEAFQFDWSCEYGVIGGLRRRPEVAHIKLAYSRAFLLAVYPLQSHEMLFGCLFHGSILSEVGASAKPGAVQLPLAHYSRAARDRVAIEKIVAFKVRCFLSEESEEPLVLLVWQI